MFRKKTKKGFTLVELVVVIAVIGILAGVSVATYFGVVNSAKKSNDEVLLTQLNTVLQTEEPISGKPKTMSEALKRLEENGFLVENLKATSDENKLFYNIKDNRFEMLGKEAVQALDGEEYWYITNSESEVENFKNKCSIYLSSNVTLASLETKYGVDGNVSSLENVTIKNMESSDVDEIIINVNTKNLTVNADNDNVYHYSDSNNVDITAVDGNSYHEYGNVSTLKILKGHVEFEKGSGVEAISVAGNGAKVTIDEGVKNPENINIYIEPGIEAGAISKPETVNDIVVKESVVDVTPFNYANFNAKEKQTDRYFVFNSDLKIFNENGKNIEIKASTKKYPLNEDKTRKVVFDLNGYTLDIAKSSGATFSIGESGNKTYRIDCEIRNGKIISRGAGGIRMNGSSLKFINCEIDCDLAYGEYTETSSFMGLGNAPLQNPSVTFENTSYNGIKMFQINKDYTINLSSGDFNCTIHDQNLIENNGILNIDSGTFSAISAGNSQGTIYNTGELTINGGTFKNKFKSAVYNTGVATLNKGVFESTSCSLCETTIPHESTYGYTIYSGASTGKTMLTINEGVKVTGVHGALAITGGGAAINGGLFETIQCANNSSHDKSHYALYIAGERSEADVIVNGGTFKALDKAALYVGNMNDGGNKEDARAVINGGTYITGGSGQVINCVTGNGYINIIGGKYSTDISAIPNLGVTTKEENGYWVVK